MAVKKGARKKEPRRVHSPVRAGSAEAAEHAARLTPPEELNGAQNEEAPPPGTKADGAIVVDTGQLKLPKGITEEEKDAPSWFGFDPVVLLILGLSLAFIAFIAYLISIEPAR